MNESNKEAPVREGDILAGKYRVARVLGFGGMGVVVAAQHIQLDEMVALKFLLPEAVADASLVNRFLREGQAAVKIRSEHVARVLDVGTLQSGAPYLVMELLEGEDLAQHVEKRGALTRDLAVDYLLQAGEAIGVAHALGIVHRDIKPANLFLTRRPDGSDCIKVLDFGISKLEKQGQFSLTGTGEVMGSPYYMSPEQFISAKTVDARSDIWSLGIVLYELLSGVPPFRADTMGEIIGQILQVPMPQISRPEVPPGLQTVLLRALAKSPADRFASVSEFAAALAPFASERSRTSLERLHGLSRAAPPQQAERSSKPLLSASGTIISDSMKPSFVGQASPSNMGGRTAPAAAPTWGTTGMPPAHPPAAAARARSPIVWVLIGGGALLLAGTAAGIWIGSRESGKGAASAAASATSPLDAASARADAQPTATGSTGAGTHANAPSAASVAPTEPSATASAVAPTVTVATATATTAAPKRIPHVSRPTDNPLPPYKPPANCNPPFTIDASGMKHPKPECT